MNGKQITAILDKLNESNSLNHKIEVLKTQKTNKVFKGLLKMTYDKVAFSYGITLKKVTLPKSAYGTGPLCLIDILDVLESEFATGNITGNEAAERLEFLLKNAEDAETADIILKVINRDLRINTGRSTINKVYGALIVKPVYQRCGTYGEKVAKKFNAKGAFVQLKADGSYREFNVQQGLGVTCVSRQGEEYSYPEIEEALMGYRLTGVFIGELTVYRDGVLLDRATGNGILRKNEIPENCRVVFDCWDVVSIAEYNNAKIKIKGTTPYHARWSVIKKYMPDHTHDPSKPGSSPCRAIECEEVNDISEALRFTARVMGEGLEGSIIKERDAIFRDGTSMQQLKLKVVIQLEVRATGFHEGTPGTVREETFGSITYETDDKKIKGRVSGFTNEQLADYNSRRDEIVGKVMTVECNDITKSKSNDFYALSHPRFIEERDDKNTTDTLESALAAKEAALLVDKEVKT